MKAIIPVAGYGSRLEPHTLTLQKCLLPVAGKPVLEHILDRITDAGITDITLIIGHLGHQVKEFCLSYENANFTFIEQTERLGLGHAVYQGLDHSDESVLIVLGDAILELNYNRLFKSQYSTIGFSPVPDPKRFGIIEINNDRIVRFWEKPDKPPSNMAIIGIYYISSQKDLSEGIKYLIDNNIRTKNEYQLTDAFTVMLDNGHQFRALEIDALLDCGIPKTLLSTNQILLEQRNTNDIHDSAIITNSHLLYCTVSQNCHVEGSELNNVIMLPGSKILHQNLENTIVEYDEVIKSKRVEIIKN